jgi:hypothetical protein
MAECITPGAEGETVWLESLAQDDWGGVAWVRGGVARYWNANPGFEKDFSYWGHNSGTSVGSTYAQTGNRGVRLAGSGDYVYITSVYDPVRGSNMVDSPTITVRGYYRHTAASTTGGVQARYDRAYLQWNTSLCKRTAGATATTWLGMTNLGSACGDPETVWTPCSRSIGFTLSSINDSLVFRARLQSTSSAAVYVDRVGVTGG